MSDVKQGMPRKYSDAQILEAIKNSLGIISTVAAKLNADRGTVHNRIKKAEHLAEALRQERERAVDMAEGVVLNDVQAGDVGTAKWVLGTIGRGRGWAGEAPDLGEITIKIVEDKDGD